MFNDPGHALADSDAKLTQESVRASGATPAGALLTLDFWLMFSCLIIGAGAGLTVINNVGSLAQSLLCVGSCNEKNCGQSTGDLLVTLISIANCAGRMLMGVVSDALKARYHRPVFFAVDIALMTLAQIILYAASPTNTAALYCGALLSGLSYGAFWVFCPNFLFDRFGGRAFGAINSIAPISATIGSYAFSVGLASALYQQNVSSGCTTVCTGSACYRTTFGILALLCGGVALPVAVWLAFRTRKFYSVSGGLALSFEDIERASPELHWQVRTRQGCLACCVCCGAWGRNLIVAPEEQAGNGISKSPYDGLKPESDWVDSDHQLQLSLLEQ